MKIISIDNFERESISDRLILSQVDLFHGSIIVIHLNKLFSGHDADKFFKLVKDDHELHEFKP